METDQCKQILAYSFTQFKIYRLSDLETFVGSLLHCNYTNI